MEVDFTAVTAGQKPQNITRQFGDGNTAQGATVSHTFTSPGLYTIQATAE
jgi:PKD repeat protein